MPIINQKNPCVFTDIFYIKGMARKKGYTQPKERKMDLKVTDCIVYPIGNTERKLKATARVTLNDALVLTSLRVYEGSQGLFVSYPNDNSYQGEDYRQMFYPLSRTLREHIEDAVLEKLKNG